MRTHRLSMTDPAGLGIFPVDCEGAGVPATASRAHSSAGTQLPRPCLAKTPVRRRGFLERLDHWFWAQQQRDLEAYLAKATDVYDLEARIRAIERNKSIPYY